VDLLAECRFGFPKPLQEETELSLELVVSKNTKSVQSDLHTKRNDQRLNSHNRVMLENWRENVDLQVIVAENACARYMAMYAAKRRTPIEISIRNTKIVCVLITEC
jgi:hypothetical protein